MQVLVTLVRNGLEPQDVAITAEDAATAADVARALADALPGGPDPRAPGPQAGDGALVTALFPPQRGRGRGPQQGGPGRVPAPQPPAAPAPPAAAPALWAGGVPARPDAPASEVLRDGMRVALEESVGALLRDAEPTGQYELRVAGGPGAGRVARLSAGAATIGSGATCTVAVPDPAIPPLALRLGIDLHGTATLRPQPGTLAYLDDESVDGEREWSPGGMLAIGESLLVLDRPTAPDAHLAATGDGGLAYNRPPRLLPARTRPRLAVPAKPVRGEGARFNLITAMVPLLFGLTMYLVTDRVMMLLFCLMTPLMVVGQYLNDLRYGKKKHTKSLRQYRAELTAFEEQVRAHGQADQRARRTAFPGPAEILLIATGPRRRLWERRLTDPDALHLRIGMAALPADIELVTSGPNRSAVSEPPRSPEITNVPVTMPFPELGVVGIAGPRSRALGSARWLTQQAAALHSPRDLSVVVLSSASDAARAWHWAHWLPHAAPRQGQSCVSLIGAEPEPLARRVNELLTELNRRQEQKRAPGFTQLAMRPEPFVLVVLDGARLLRRMPGVPQLLQEGPQHGIFALCLDDDERLLPEECRAVVAWPADSGSRVRLRGAGLESAGEVLADQVTPEWCELLSRSLAPVRDVSRDDADSALPTSARLLSLLEMPNPAGEDIARIWRAGGQTTAAPIGLAADGVFVLDIRRDGPHALVAGTTGAGKSELLQTVIASLAVANHPEALNFVLIDYKGGSAFQDCAHLPHTVGMVSDLDAHLTERALASLAAELHRRESILFRSGNKDIEDYNDDRRQRPGLAPMPRLVLIIDEFASLVAELPDFIAGLVDIARRGRSLGVHLILATQRPAGVVSADIRANTNLRMALRVTDGKESTDVIDAPDAGTIAKSTPGRLYVRSGAQSLVGVQSARIGGRRPREDTSGPRARVVPMSWAAYGRPLPSVQAAEDDGTMVTDLAVLVEAVRDGAAQLGFGPPRRPWLPPLPERIVLDDLPAGDDKAPAGDAAPAEGSAPAEMPAEMPADVPGETPGDEVRPAPFGVTDLPAQQRRAPLALDLAHGDHLMVVGGPRSGRSTALRSLAGSLARSTRPADVHLYAADCASNALLPLVALPHTGAVVTREQPDRVRRLLDRLRREISRRQQLLAEQGVSSAAEQRARARPEDRLPWMVFLLDGWEGFVQAFEKYNHGQLLESVQQIFREGASVGLTAVLSSDRRGLSGQLSSVFPDKLILRLADTNDYSAAGFRSSDVPGEMPPGRTLRFSSEGVLESQIALLAEDDSGQAQVAALQEIGRRAKQRGGPLPPSLAPMRVDALPSRISLAEALALAPGFTPPSPLWALLGVGGDELHPLGIDLEESGPGFVIAGPPKSGRSTTLCGVARMMLRQGTPLVLITPRRSPLRELAGTEGVLGVLGADSAKTELEELAALPEGPYAVLVDDAELLYDTPLDKVLQELLRKGMDGANAVVAAGSTDSLSSQYRGFAANARKTRNGMLLMPRSPGEGELFGVRLPANSGGGPVGSGILVAGGALTPLQSAWPD